MKLSSAVLIAVVLVAMPVWAQEKKPPLQPVKPEDIKGEVTNPTLSIKPGQAIAAGDLLTIEFEYTTETPGKTAVAAEAIINGKAVQEWFFTTATRALPEKAGKWKVMLGSNSGADIIADEIRLYVWPINAPGRRDVATVKGPVRFVGSWSTNKVAPIIQTAQIGGKEGDQVTLMTRELVTESRKDKDGKVHEVRVEKNYPGARLFAKDVQAYGLDGKPLEQAEMAKRLAKPTPVVLFAAWGKVELPDPYYLQLFKEGTVALVVPRDTLYPRSAPKIDQKGP